MLEGSLLRQLEELIVRQARASEFVEIASKCQMSAGMQPAEWTDSLGALARLAIDPFSWFTPGEVALLHFGSSRQIAIALTECWPFQTESLEEDELKYLIGNYINWLVTQPDDRVCAFCWALLRAQPRRQGSVSQSPIYWLLRQGRLKDDIELPAIELAVALTDEETAMFWWPDERWAVTDWTTASKPYLHFLDHPSSLVRAAAAKTLGRLNTGLRGRIDTPPIPELLRMIARREEKSAGVAGPFLEGSDWGIDDWTDLLGDYDMRGWFLDTLRNSGKEPDWPEAQALEFYAQEFLADDGDAIEQMVEMGREELALMTATSAAENVELLRPVLERMARSENSKIANAMQAYLAEHGQSTGRQWLN